MRRPARVHLHINYRSFHQKGTSREKELFGAWVFYICRNSRLSYKVKNKNRNKLGNRPRCKWSMEEIKETWIIVMQVCTGDHVARGKPWDQMTHQLTTERMSWSYIGSYHATRPMMCKRRSVATSSIGLLVTRWKMDRFYLRHRKQYRALQTSNRHMLVKRSFVVESGERGCDPRSPLHHHAAQPVISSYNNKLRLGFGTD